ncbi:hypothetical protein HK097_002494 [Rhizophlyctis rosea]|uniref:Uncharacterized protein n=1 Tax=Rhizophlyctis rosea TaxID=64517 RepID=A0AAD5SIS3_9FUNG|nr:hypothetical protein HK097_002494 [Rhizophlyctis rosea]
MSSHKRDRRDDDKEDSSRRRKDDEKPEKRRKHRPDNSPDDDSEDEAVKKARDLIPKISEDDYYNKSTEFQMWLREEKKLYFFDLSGEEARSYFKKFVRRWNKARLSSKYYKKMLASEIPAAEKSGFKWKFKNTSEADLDNARDSIYSATHSTELLAPRRPARAPQGPSMPPTRAPAGPSKLPEDEDMDEEDRKRYARALAKKAHKSDRQTHELILEELVPKSTGREAMLEKRRAQNAYHKAERDVDPEIAESDLMGGDDFRSRVAAERKAKERWEQRKGIDREAQAAGMADKVQAYRAKEEATLAMFRQMAGQHKLG